MKIIHILIFSLLLIISYSTKFNIISTSVCTSTSPAGFCTKWEQNGTVDQQIPACFSGKMIVLTKQGYKTFQQLSIGDQILSYDRARGQVYTKVRGWFHRENETNAEYLQITFNNDETLVVSQKHNLAIQTEGQENDYQFVFASQVGPHQKLFGRENSVKQIKIIKEIGMYAPMTYNNNYFVYSSKQGDSKRVLAHDFAHIRNPQTYEPVYNMMISVYQQFKGKYDQNGIHPVASLMMKKFRFLLQY